MESIIRTPRHWIRCYSHRNELPTVRPETRLHCTPMQPVPTNCYARRCLPCFIIRVCAWRKRSWRNEAETNGSHCSTSLHRTFRLVSMKVTFLYLSMGLAWNWVHYYWSHLLTYITSPGWWLWWRSNWRNKWLTGEIEVVGENLPQCRSVHHRSNTTRPRLKPMPLRWEAGDQSPELRHGHESHFVGVSQSS
jgi:hypothetical protein